MACEPGTKFTKFIFESTKFIRPLITKKKRLKKLVWDKNQSHKSWSTRKSPRMYIHTFYEIGKSISEFTLVAKGFIFLNLVDKLS